MKAIVLRGPGQPLAVESLPRPKPARGQLLVQLKAAAINHRDLWIWQGNYHGITYPCVPGSDGSGVVVEVADDADKKWLGENVIINPSLHWGDRRAGQDNNFEILGIPAQGTFAGYVSVPSCNVFPLPEGYDFEKGAALPLAGLTAHRALFYRGDLKAGQHLLITGIGGGVAAFLLGFAIRAGAHVYVSSSSDEKLEKAKMLGAIAGVNYTVDGWQQSLARQQPDGFDLIVDSAAGPSFPSLINLLKTGGKIVNFGRTAGPFPEMSSALLFYKQASILGTTMGSPIDFTSMLEFIHEHNMRPVIDKVFDIEQAQQAFQHVQEKHQFGKVVFRITDDFSR